jgi:hypothetical protein
MSWDNREGTAVRKLEKILNWGKYLRSAVVCRGYLMGFNYVKYVWRVGMVSSRVAMSRVWDFT